jgi:hypothetical protein
MFAKYILQETKKISKFTHSCLAIIVTVTRDHSFASLQRVLLISKDILTVFHLFFLVLQTVELTILEIIGLQEDLGSFIMETITLSNQVPVPDLGMPVLFWTSVCVMKTIYSLWLDLDIVSCARKLYMLLSFCMDIYLGGVLKIYMLLAMRKP